MGIEPAELVIMAFVLLLSLSLHEAAHAWTADRLGDPTARELGRVTINPLPHIDLFGTVIFPLVAFTQGWLFGWAKPVPVNSANLSHPRRDNVLIAAAGPASNVVLGAAFLLLIRFDLGFEAIHQLAFWGLVLNALLAVFNLIPVPPLDGSWILEGLLPSPFSGWVAGMRPYGFFILIALIFAGVLHKIINPVLGFVVALAAP